MMYELITFLLFILFYEIDYGEGKKYVLKTLKLIMSIILLPYTYVPQVDCSRQIYFQSAALNVYKSITFKYFYWRAQTYLLKTVKVNYFDAAHNPTAHALINTLWSYSKPLTHFKSQAKCHVKLKRLCSLFKSAFLM